MGLDNADWMLPGDHQDEFIPARKCIKCQTARVVIDAGGSRVCRNCGNRQGTNLYYSYAQSVPMQSAVRRTIATSHGDIALEYPNAFTTSPTHVDISDVVERIKNEILLELHGVPAKDIDR